MNKAKIKNALINHGTYGKFQDLNGNEYVFKSYADFSAWWFSVPYRRMVQSLDKSTFRKLDRAATQSKEARKKSA